MVIFEQTCSGDMISCLLAGEDVQRVHAGHAGITGGLHFCAGPAGDVQPLLCALLGQRGLAGRGHLPAPSRRA